MQVYRATLTPQYGSAEVAIKVQRPRLREAISLDLYLMRAAALYVRYNVLSVSSAMVLFGFSTTFKSFT
jgi:aarF domain-containing kinase